jgi:hypothetical protein
MQNRYAGNIGDLSKFMPIRHVIGQAFVPAGFVWYAHPNEDHDSDGRHVAYLGEKGMSVRIRTLWTG